MLINKKDIHKRLTHLEGKALDVLNELNASKATSDKMYERKLIFSTLVELTSLINIMIKDLYHIEGEPK